MASLNYDKSNNDDKFVRKLNQVLRSGDDYVRQYWFTQVLDNCQLNLATFKMDYNRQKETMKVVKEKQTKYDEFKSQCEVYWEVAEELKEVKVEHRERVKCQINGETPSLATIHKHIDQFDKEYNLMLHNIKWCETLMKTDHIGMRFIIELRQGNNQQAQYMLNQFKLLIDEILEMSEVGAGLGCRVSPTEYKKQNDGQAQEVELEEQVAEQGYI